ncbi:DUF2058 family protein [Pyxidicoccus fallax]|uniref:DUF2058 domain-containing protein n=1 Tax=Pyxidicoccus fallax TaxID=394095 RepID=A0A848LFM5_9BACT|nr:DUF2058 family protein [Pyxidicoccus fallax]NMO17162.1 DUF2058 domain-containing protein [Pyxidicoccus fallax]NPC85070.1 DUF2058 family protein [Pyxidicoccus fallax]
MQNLRDKLLKAGLVTEEQAKKVETKPSQAEARRPPPQEGGRPGGNRSGPPRDENRTQGGPPNREGGGREGGRREGGGRPGGGGGRFAPGGGGRPGGGGAPRYGGGPQQGRPAAAPEKAIPKLPPLPGSKAYQRAESKKQVELDRALRELVLGSQIPIEAGETTFYFMTRKGKLRRLELSPAQAKQLEDGELGVVERPEPAQIEHSLVPAAAAEQMYALSKKAVRFLNRKENPVGFMNDEELKAQQAAEAAGTAPELPDEPEANEGGEGTTDAAPAADASGQTPEGEGTVGNG